MRAIPTTHKKVYGTHTAVCSTAKKRPQSSVMQVLSLVAGGFITPRTMGAFLGEDVEDNSPTFK